MKLVSRCLIFFLAALAITPYAAAQGKNKIPYEDFEWQIYKSEHFKFYFYEDEAHLLEEMVNMTEAAYTQVSTKLQHSVNFHIPMIFYKTHEEFEQTNIFEGFIPRFVGGFTEPFQSRMVIPIDDEPERTYALIAHELTHAFQYDMLYNNKLSTILRTNAPRWFIEGMASWVSDDEDNLDRMILRDTAINTNFQGVGQFSGLSFLAYRVGHAAFDYMEQEYGIEGVRNFLWQYRKNVTGSVGSAIERAFEIDIEDFDRNFRKHLRRRYVELLPKKEEPDDHAREIRTRRTLTTLSPELSPSGDLFAAVIPWKNELDLVLISTKDGRIFKNLTRGYTNRYTEINVNAFRGVNDLGWSFDGNELAFSARREGANRLFTVSAVDGDLSDEIRFDDIRDAQSPIFSKDSAFLYFVGNSDGRYDIFQYDRQSKEVVNITKDAYHDRNPRLSPDGKEILYSSSRDGFYKIFTVNLATGEKTQLTSGLGNDIQATYSQDMKSIYFSSDRFDDIYNIYQLDLETGIKKQYTDILTGAFSPQERTFYDHKEGREARQLVFTAYYQGRYRVYRMDKPEAREVEYEVSQDNYANVKQYKMDAGLKLDPERYQEYKIFDNFNVSGVNVAVGATDDGRILSNSSLEMSDTLGNHVFDVQTYTVSSRENYFVNYLNRKNRWQWGGYFWSRNDYIINPYDFQRSERTVKYQDLAGYLRYPFSTFTRIDFNAGFTDRDFLQATPIFDGEGTIQSYLLREVDFTEPFASITFSRDTVRYASYGPQHGSLLSLGVGTVFSQNEYYNLDFRAYQELTRRSLIAFRTIANYSTGDVPNLYVLGGTNYLRGDYEYQQFVGSRRLLTQFELRFPLIDRLSFAGGFTIGNVRAAFFVEAGGTWFDDDNFNFEFQDSEGDNPWNADDPDPNYLIGSYGAEISMTFFGLELHWTWAKRTNFEEFPTGSRMSFWIGHKF